MNKNNGSSTTHNNVALRRRHIARACKKYGMLIHPAAMNAWLKDDYDVDDWNESLDVILHALVSVLSDGKGRNVGPKLITLPILQTVLKDHHSNRGDDVDMEVDEDNDDDNDMDDTKPNRHSTLHDFTNHNASKSSSNIPINSKTKKKSSTTTKGLSSNKKKIQNNASTAPRRSWTIVSAFDTPKLVYDSMREQFRYDDHTSSSSSSSLSLMGTAQDLIDMRTQRFLLIRQRVIRIRQKQQLPSLITIDRLLGMSRQPQPNNHRHQTSSSSSMEHVLLGMLRNTSYDSFSNGCFLELEDLTGSIPLQIVLNPLSSTQADRRHGGGRDDIDKNGMTTTTTIIEDKGVYINGTTVLVHGYYQENGIFVVRHMELPPLEKSADTNQLLPPSPYQKQFFQYSYHYSKATKEQPTRTTKIYAMANLKLDDPICLEALTNLVRRMDKDAFLGEQDSGIPHHPHDTGSILVLFGNFQTDTIRLSSALEEIAKILKTTTFISTSTTRHSVLILPGPQDVAPNACWPLRPFHSRELPNSLRDMMDHSNNNTSVNVYMCTNPCRLQFQDGRSVLLLRKDLIRESLENQVLATTTNNTTLDRKVLYHMLSQGHILPVSTTTNTNLHPIYWNFDHAMRITPLPDIIVTSMDASDYYYNHSDEEGLEYVRSGCRILIPPCRQNYQNWIKVTLPIGQAMTNQDDTIQVEMGQDDDDEDDDDDDDNNF